MFVNCSFAAKNRRFINALLFGDEAKFSNRLVPNHQNRRMWARHNPHWIIELDNHQNYSVMVWGGIVGFRVIGPHFFEGNVNQETYGLLLDQLPQYLDNAGVDNQIRRRMWFLHDGAPPHRAIPTVERLNAEFDNRWVGSNGPVVWSAYSPDHNLCDTFLWGYVHTYLDGHGPPHNIQHLRELITDAFGSITREMIGRAYENYLMRQRLCIDLNGHHFEHIIKCARCNPYL